MATCLPESVLEFVENRHTSLRNFTISCHLENLLIQDDNSTELNNLKTLVIRGDSMYRLALLNNPPSPNTLKSLEYDSLERFDNSDLELISETEEDQISMWQGWVTANTFPHYTILRSLSFSNVVLHPVIANSIDFSLLSRLTLRSCPGWRDLLRVILDGSHTLSLTTFELIESEFRTYPPDPAMERYDILCDFLSEIPELERLFLALRAPALVIGLAAAIQEHRATLKRLVFHERMEDHSYPDHPPMIHDFEHPKSTLGSFFSIDNVPLVEAVGYCCALESGVCILYRSVGFDCLKY